LQFPAARVFGTPPILSHSLAVPAKPYAWEQTGTEINAYGAYSWHAPARLRHESGTVTARRFSACARGGPAAGKKKARRFPPPGPCLALGDSLLSHGKLPHYHRRQAVSLPGSGWVRVVHARYGHQAVRFEKRAQGDYRSLVLAPLSFARRPFGLRGPTLCPGRGPALAPGAFPPRAFCFPLPHGNLYQGSRGHFVPRLCSVLFAQAWGHTASWQSSVFNVPLSAVRLLSPVASLPASPLGVIGSSLTGN
jgi:hypothetical protein